MTTTNLSAKLAEFRKLSRDRMQTVVEKSLIRSGTSVIVESPVDTGRFAANWMFAFGDYDGTTINGDFSGEGEKQGSINKLTSNVSNIELGSTFFMTNSLPYADRLENKEWSAKGSKMVYRAVMNFPAVVADEVGKVK